MKQLATCWMIALCVTTVVAQKETQTRTLEEFHAIELSGPFEVRLVPSHEHAIKITTKGTVSPDEVKTQVHNKKLCISYRQKKRDFCNSQRIVLEVHCHNLKEIITRGVYRLFSYDTLRSDKLVLKVEGVGNVDLLLNVEKLEAHVCGVGNTELKGIANEQSVRQSGVGNYKASELVCSKVQMHVEGVGNAEIHATKQLEIEAIGIGNVRYRGNPEIIRTNASFLNKIRHVN
ncbi:MAG: head GIN domain-containing protein [Cytophagales bacterium]|nr:DUF2807 domain-containing protein [Bernardetiaceae bacterium]MDW8209880.1 head GIN domain-containing protein [Cytophagales bacterium]